MKSCLRAIPSFIERYPYPNLEIHPADAAERGIEAGDVVIIKTLRGKVTMRAGITDRIMAGFVYAPVGGGGPQGPEAWQQANVNLLTDDQQYDPISGFPVYKTLLCEVKKKKRIRRGAASADPSLGCGG
jgi:anaerobic selenocysteine-containing dehydrogenase